MLRRGLLAAVLLATGCVQQPQRQGLSASAARPSTTRALTATQPVYIKDEALEARVCPPAGWKLDPPKVTGQHVHKTWLSPTRATAYGIIHFKLPLPVGAEMALWGFMREMKKSEGEAVLLEKEADPQLPNSDGGGIRFVAEGGIYKVRTNLTVKGLTGWAVYAGTLRGKPEIEAELSEAIEAREATRVGLQN